MSAAELLKNRSAAPLDYQEPEDWTDPSGPNGSMPPSNDPYFIEEIKNGTIVATHKLVSKSFFVVGRLPGESDLQLFNPGVFYVFR